MLQVGDRVQIEDSADIDCHEAAWQYIKDHRQAVVKAIRARPAADTHQGLVEVALEFDDEFPGGHDCKNLCAPKRGQFVMGNNLSLCFDESRPTPLMTGPSFPEVDYNKLSQVL